MDCVASSHHSLQSCCTPHDPFHKFDSVLSIEAECVSSQGHPHGLGLLKLLHTPVDSADGLVSCVFAMEEAVTPSIRL